MPTAADIMTPEVLTIRSSAKVTRAIALMQKNQVRTDKSALRYRSSLSGRPQRAHTAS
ncbi:MAG: hypothetical protein WBB01_13295 [Phormidesmis sp.]